MKKRSVAIIALLILLAGIVLVVALCSKADMTFATEGKAIFKYGDKNISQEISSDDFTKICDLFDGKWLYSDDLSCGFTENVSVMMNGSESFCFACDSCPIVYQKSKNKYLKLSSSEYDELKEILYTYGFVFPCL